MKLLRSKRGMAALAAILLLLFLARPGVYGLRNRIANSIGSALGRKVTLDNVRVHLLPRPGFDLEGLVIDDDPAFSAEPMIRAQDVSAAIRFRSLLRGRLEIATLSATEPSINLSATRKAAGTWPVCWSAVRTFQWLRPVNLLPSCDQPSPTSKLAMPALISRSGRQRNPTR